MNQVSGMSSNAMTVKMFSDVTMPSSSPPMSEIRNQWWCCSLLSPECAPCQFQVLNALIFGD
jgi:hypothetical protein